jgi:hypothetical protein
MKRGDRTLVVTTSAWAALVLAGCGDLSAGRGGEVQRIYDGCRHTLSVDPDDIDFSEWRRDRSRQRTGAETALIADLAMQLLGARNSGDDRAVARLADAIIDVDATDISAHLERARLFHTTDGHAAAVHEAIAAGLLQSVLADQHFDFDRNAPTTPLRVYSLREAAATLEAADLRPTPATILESLRPTTAPASITVLDRRGSARMIVIDLLASPGPPTRAALRRTCWGIEE